MNDTIKAADTLSIEPPEPTSKLLRGLRIAGWTFFTLFCLLTFTLIKLPEDRIRNLVQGYIGRPSDRAAFHSRRPRAGSPSAGGSPMS